MIIEVSYSIVILKCANLYIETSGIFFADIKQHFKILLRNCDLILVEF